MIQIPKPLLPSDMDVYLVDPDSKRGGVYLEPFTIGRVRFESSEALSVTDYSLTDGASGRIWIDAVNSVDPQEVPAGSKVVIDGQKLHVLTCATYRIGRRIHHWELDVA